MSTLRDARVIRSEIRPHLQGLCLYAEMEGESIRYLVSGTNMATGEVFHQESFTHAHFAAEEWVFLSGRKISAAQCVAFAAMLRNEYLMRTRGWA